MKPKRNLFDKSPGDWPEDFEHDNGQYICRCRTCDEHFTGYKRRIECKVCATVRESNARTSSGEARRSSHSAIQAVEATTAQESLPFVYDAENDDTLPMFSSKGWNCPSCIAEQIAADDFVFTCYCEEIREPDPEGFPEDRSDGPLTPAAKTYLETKGSW